MRVTLPRNQVAAASCSGRRKESSTVKVLPWPGVLSTLMMPPIRSTRFLVMAMPRPVPCIWLMRSLSSRLKASKTCFWNSSLMPMPSSWTEKRSFTYWGAAGRSVTERSMWPPSGVYFTALDIRLMSI